MAEPIVTDDQRQYARLVLYQVYLGLVLVAINHRAIQVALPTLTHVFHTDLSFIQWVLLVYDLAVIGLVLIAMTMLVIAALLVMAGRPLGGLFATAAASVHVVLIRYLQRPSVRAHFGAGERCEVRGER